MSGPFALLLTPALPRLDLPVLIDRLKQRHPDVPIEADLDSTTGQSAGRVAFRWAGHQLLVEGVDERIPDDDAPWSRAAMSWDDPGAAADRHRAHLVVSTTKPAEAGKLDAARAVTAVVGGLIGCTPDICGVVWSGMVARDPELWLERSREAFGPYPALSLLWLDVYTPPLNRGFVLRTLGLSVFIGREIESDLPGVDSETLLQKTLHLAVYLIGHGDVIKETDTIDISEGNRAKVYRCASPLDGSPVLRVGCDPTSRLPKPYAMIAPAIAKHHPLLLMLEKVGLFDLASPHNLIDLVPADYVSEARLDGYDDGVKSQLTKILASDSYVAADQKARDALARGDAETAKAALMSVAEDVKRFQADLRYALTRGQLYLFVPLYGPSANSN